MAADDETLKLIEILLTAELFNSHQNLDANDLTPECRNLFTVNGTAEVKRPLHVSEGMVRRSLGIENACRKLEQAPVVTCEEFGQRIKLTALEPAARWFLKIGGMPQIEKNPTLAFFFEHFESTKVSYEKARQDNPPIEDTRVFLQSRLTKILADDERLKNAMDLIILSAPEEVEQDFNDLVCTRAQENIIRKIQVARTHRDILRRHRIHEVGKLLFVGPPGTGKTSLALALARKLHLPLLEVRLSMITSQYLGETSKNIDRIFELAKALSPCILFIDEFDFVAKSRVADDHGAMKRAVNSLLKNIDQVSLIRHGVLLVGATNHPQLLDEAAWRRFDEVVEFGLPDREMRRAILEKVSTGMQYMFDIPDLAERTEGFSGADLRIMIKEALLSSLMDHRDAINITDIERGITVVKNRDTIRSQNWLS
ncbi:MAG TPA: ATP-binding protein [Methanolinea sp.]|jgi:SpoVK/Ycf46/Vps4 family AAA+-type ATPase|nr:MAG: VCP-like ATPase [Methanoregulaceae archaeon PtaB.Bin009]OPY40442.1 MAG: VCP-like ATPase [Methanoregulaceae archaeon PtaU1.Bin066]HII76298.1 ATP-binding protein [Methanolinea sp.]HNQ30046.1 ATP-binding protein [Methanolinea sp.]HNS82679.1 ATP-binding protein [Methanolinea sp.]